MSQDTGYDVTYVNAIDIYIDKTLNDVHMQIKSKDTYQKVSVKEIDSLITKIGKTIKATDLKNNIFNDKTIETITEIVFNYIFIYIYLTKAFTGTIESVQSELISYKGDFELSPNMINTIVSHAKLIKDIDIILQNMGDLTKVKDIEKKKEALDFLNSLGGDIVTNEILKNKETYKHNIIKTVIFRLIYLESDKTRIFNLIEKEELQNTEFIYIEIVESLVDEIDYSIFKEMFAQKELEYGTADYLYNLLTDDVDDEDTKFLTKRLVPLKQKSTEKKINELFDRRFLIPITDDILRYHKSTESYDKNTDATKIDPKVRTSKKDNTKIRYIVTKFNKILDYYNIIQKNNKSSIDEIEKMFHSTIPHRKAVLINELEELSIITKLLNQGQKAISNNEYYDDLLSFREYPYLNYKDIAGNGFSFHTTNTTTAIRSATFEFKDNEKYPAQYKNDIQTRVAPAKRNVNIIGVALNPFDVYEYERYTSVPCIKVKDTEQLNSNSNGYLNAVQLLKQQIVNSVSHDKLYYWLFSRATDKLDVSTYQNISQMHFEEYFKLLLGKLYDEIAHFTYEKIINHINEIKNISWHKVKELLSFTNTYLLDITETQYYNEIINYVFYTKLNNPKQSIYDVKENIIPGVTTELIKIPRYVPKKKDRSTIRIKKQEYLTGEVEEDIDPLMEEAVCQHHITWNAVNRYKKYAPNKFNQALFEFIKKYLIETKNNEYVCKSCYQFLDIKKYVHESFIGDQSNIALSVSLEADLENVSEYEKYSRAIKNMDKIVEKLAYVIGLQAYIGTAIMNKRKRQDIVKNTIDLIILQFSNAKSEMVSMEYTKKRNEVAQKMYGIDPRLTKLFEFDMTNDLFTFSSKETDIHKKKKNNNILLYFIFMIINELSGNHVLQFNEEKLINYQIFYKLTNSYFDGLFIHINDAGDVKKISEFPLLCYVIYFAAAQLIKYKYWFIDSEIYESKKNTLNPLLHKTIIHTLVHLINSILEQNTHRDKNYIYAYNSTRFFVKLNDLYSKNAGANIIKQLNEYSSSKIQIVDNKIKIKSSDDKTIKVDGSTILKSTFDNVNKINVPKYQIRSFSKTLEYDGILDGNLLTKLHDEQFIKHNTKIYKLYEQSGNKRAIPKLKAEIDNKKLGDHTDKVRNTFVNNIKESVKDANNINNLMTIKKKDTNAVLKKLDEAYEKNIIKTVNNFISLLDGIMGKDTNINNKNIYLHKTVYHINNNHLGTKQEPIIIPDDDRIQYKKNDPFFKIDVIQYVDKQKNISMYYDAVRLFYLGYKELNREYVKVNEGNNYLRIDRSINDKLLLLGFMRYNVLYDDDDKIKIINDIISNRTHNLKNIIKEIQLFLYQIKNKKSSEIMNNTVKSYFDKFKDLVFYKKNGERIFEDWRVISANIYPEKLNNDTNIDIQKYDGQNLFNTKQLSKFNGADQKLLFYLCKELQEFIEINMNTNKHKLVTLIALLINIIYKRFTLVERIHMNNEVRKLELMQLSTYLGQSEEYIDLNALIDEPDKDKMTDEEKEKHENEQDNAKYADEALDMDQNMDENNDETDEGDEMIQDAED